MLANVITDVFDKLNDYSSAWWFLLVIFGVAFFDSVIPIVPSETTVIIGGVAAGLNDDVPRLVAVIAAGALGAFAGDNAAYQIGMRASDFFQRRAAKNQKFATKLDWATEQIHERGGLLLITARFIPGGRTALTLSSGITRQPKTWFVKWIAVAAMIWAAYASLLGYFGGKAFEDDHTKAFLVAFTTAISITVLIEVIRHFRKKRAGLAH